MNLTRVKSIKMPSMPSPAAFVPSYLRVSKSTLIAIGIMALLTGLVSLWAYHYTRLSHPSYVCGILGLDHLRYEKERRLVEEEMNDEFVNGYRYSLHFQGISPEGYRILIENNPVWNHLGPGQDRYYASHMQPSPSMHASGDFYAQTDIKYCTLTYTSYIGKLLPVSLLWLMAFVVGTILAISVAVVALSISLKAARGVSWPANYSTWRAAMLVSAASFIMLSIALTVV